jgi:hypothetical protein
MKERPHGDNLDEAKNKQIVAISNNDVGIKAMIKPSGYLFLLQCYFPMIFYFVYVYCANILKHDFGYTASEIIYHNFLISLFHLASLLVTVFLLYKMHPFRLIRWVLYLGLITAIISSYYFSSITNGEQLFVMQVMLIIFAPHDAPAAPIIYKCFPVLRRFTYISFIYAMSRAITFVAMAFGSIYIMQIPGNFGLIIATIPAMIAFYMGLRFFEKQELQRVSNKP